ncbi:Dipeptidyl peptidase 4 [Hypsibius exemplaris]|uniref:Dipeptidyl peptidase 4 n=1 Tax=Hypsibius exemplaris TaxID=2072580 RepID=A0A1W0WB94_HYPEX|nr:Dipeptidyl peptidase 4 [Hypsibius exemplaris]
MCAMMFHDYEGIRNSRPSLLLADQCAVFVARNVCCFSIIAGMGFLSRGASRKTFDLSVRKVNTIDPDLTELNGPESSGRNWKGVGIALLVIAVICALVILAIVLGAPTHEEHYREGVPLTLYDVTDGSLNPSFKEVQWFSGHELLYQADGDQSIILHNLETNNTSTFLHLKASEHIDSYSVAPNGSYVLVTQNTQKVYRHTNKAFYRVLDIQPDRPSTLNSSVELAPKNRSKVKLQYAAFAPTSNQLVFVYENDIYYKESPSPLVGAVQLTNTGSTDEKEVVIYNGIPDWLYEEEILSSDHAVWWSPDSRYLAYLEFNDTKVETFSFETYGGDSLTQQYVNNTKIRYPKAGTTNPTVTLYILDPVNVAKTGRIPGRRAFVKPPKGVEDFNGEYYITTVSWLSNDKLLVRWTNRYQNISILSSCSPTSSDCVPLITLGSSNGWLEDSPPFSLNDGKKLMLIAPAEDEEQHQSICSLDIGTESPSSRLDCLKTEFDITEILTTVKDSQGRDVIYALAAYEAPRFRHIVKIVENNISCVTCNLALPRNCTYYSDVKFSMTTSQFLVLTCRGPHVPFMQIWSTHNLTSGQAGVTAHTDIRSNAKLQTTIDRKGIPRRKYFEVPLTTLPHGPKAQAELLLPPKMAEYAVKRYPLLIKVYGGPGTQEVHTRYRMDIEELMASAHETVIVRIDGRGSGFQGNKFKHYVNRNLGFLEIKDQLEVARWVLQEYPFLDPNRVGIWGWSYGGYASARAVLLDTVPQVIKCAAAVAPVTDWRFYDTAYTERFMSTPDDNPKAYENSNLMPYSPETLYWHFARTSFLLVHGTADDNVHFQQAAQFTKALMKADVIFKTQFYPDEDHSIRKLRLHLYHTLMEHFLTCFGSESIHEKGDD